MGQGDHTGLDGEPEGARVLDLRGAAKATARGGVSYPQADRVDWVRIDLPPDADDRLALALRFRPRGAARFRIELFDASYEQVATDAGARWADVVVDHARGSYYAMICARKRADAGAYELVATRTPMPLPEAPFVDTARPHCRHPRRGRTSPRASSTRRSRAPRRSSRSAAAPTIASTRAGPSRSAAGGRAPLIKIMKRTAVAKVRVPYDEVRASSGVVDLEPPP